VTGRSLVVAAGRAAVEGGKILVENAGAGIGHSALGKGTSLVLVTDC
jgi:hypothetical protein